MKEEKRGTEKRGEDRAEQKRREEEKKGEQRRVTGGEIHLNEREKRGVSISG